MSARPSRPKGQGQWALGYSEPLNPNERMKKDQDGFAVRDRILNLYPFTGFDSIDPQDLRGRFRWWGLYTQRKAGIDGGKTAILEPEEIEDSYFMQRIRLDGGRMTSDQLRVIASISTNYGRDVADVTDRQNIQLHWIRIEDVPAIWGALETAGMTTAESCGDTPRVILGCPLAGVDGDEVIDATGVIDAVVERFVGDTTLTNLPRKFKTAMSGCADHCTHPRDQRHRLRRCRAPRAGRRLRPVGRRRAVDESEARGPARHVRRAGPGARRLARRGVAVP